MKNKLSNSIPAAVSAWTDKYFHQSAFDKPLNFPSNNVVNFLSKFRPLKPVKLFRGIHEFNGENYTGIESWTYNRKTAEKYAASEKNGKVEEATFSVDNILLDTTLLGSTDKKYLGYDYNIDDKEVLVFKKIAADALRNTVSGNEI